MSKAARDYLNAMKHKPHPRDRDHGDFPGSVFVFGSNLAGAHGGGAALYAKKLGAELGVGEGWTSLSTYAIPTKDYEIQTLPLTIVAQAVRRFLGVAREHQKQYPGDQFFVTRIGCGLAGFRDSDIAPLFQGAPSNCILPVGWPFVMVDSLGQAITEED